VTAAADKHRTLAEIAEERLEWRRRGLRVVLANGAFDLLHVGHLRYLAGARGHGDRLVVAVNSDRSMATYKGPERPIMPEAERVELLSHLWMVDRICIFDEPTVTVVLETLLPEVHAKGTDYTVETVPERDVVKAYGGETVICGDPKDHATTDLISTIVERFGSSQKE
jgi:rfaE bifunctional protein nucleotidyltransferase chain/domain